MTTHEGDGPVRRDQWTKWTSRPELSDTGQGVRIAVPSGTNGGNVPLGTDQERTRGGYGLYALLGDCGSPYTQLTPQSLSMVLDVTVDRHPLVAAGVRPDACRVPGAA
jgi:hypothetical protein